MIIGYDFFEDYTHSVPIYILFNADLDESPISYKKGDTVRDEEWNVYVCVQDGATNEISLDNTDYWQPYTDESIIEQLKALSTEDNDGVAFDTCNPINNVDIFTLTNGSFDEFHTTKDTSETDNGNTDRTEWGVNSVLLAKFQGDLSAGTISAYGYDIHQIEVRRRKKGEQNWQSYFAIDYNQDITTYSVIDKFIGSEEVYEYCLCPIALDGNGNRLVGTNSDAKEIDVTYDNTCIFDNTDSYNLIYDLEFGDITSNIGANIINTLGSQHPYVVYDESDYVSGNIKFLLVSEESATGDIDVRSEKKLKDKILSFFNNKQPKILKHSDGTYMLIQIVGTPTLTPLNNPLGIYQLSFEYVQVGNIDDVNTLSNLNFEFNYICHNKTDDTLEQITKGVGAHYNE